MSKIFEDGKVYKFSEKKCMKDTGHNSSNCSWVRECKGRIVDNIISETRGEIGYWDIKRNWCKVVKNN